MTQQMKRFCEEYTCGRSGADAYRVAYKVTKGVSARRCASRLLHRQDVQEEIARLKKEIETDSIMQSREMQMRLTAIARQEALVEVIVNGKKVMKRPTCRDAIRAIELLCKIQGNFAPEKQEVDLSGSAPIVLVDDVPEDD